MGKKIIAILILLFTVYYVWRFYFPHYSDNSQIALPGDSVQKKEVSIPEIKVKFPPVTDNLKNISLDCKSSPEIPAAYRKEKIICQNVYTADIGKIEEEIRVKNSKRLVLYGQRSISNCPIESQGKNKVENMLEGCLEMSKFIDLYQLPKTAQLLGIGLPSERLFIYWEEDAEKIEKACKKKAGGCYFWGKYIILTPGSLTKASPDEEVRRRFYPEGIAVGATFTSYSDKNIAYYYDEIFPKGCAINYLEVHELIHFFDYQARGVVPLWFEEPFDAILAHEIQEALCPPGIEYVNAREFRNGKMKSVENLDVDSDDYLLAVMGDWYGKSSCHKAAMVSVNRLFSQGGWPYIQKLNKSIRNNRSGSYNKEMPDRELVMAILESANFDPQLKEYLYTENRCPKGN